MKTGAKQRAMPTKKLPAERERPAFFKSRVPMEYEDEIFAMALRTHGKVRSRDAMVGILVGEALEARRAKEERKKNRGKNPDGRTPKKVRHASQSNH